MIVTCWLMGRTLHQKFKIVKPKNLKNSLDNLKFPLYRSGMTQLKIAGIAGGVGTTVTATLLEGIDNHMFLTNADIVVARNDFRCLKALNDRVHHRIGITVKILLICEPNRALTVADFQRTLERDVCRIDVSKQIARADDANSLSTSAFFVQIYTQRLKDTLGLTTISNLPLCEVTRQHIQ